MKGCKINATSAGIRVWDAVEVGEKKCRRDASKGGGTEMSW